jgi:hypothetical protein
MNKRLIALLISIMSGSTSLAVFAAPGEYWEVTSKMEMPGMPFAMPATMQKVCIPKGSESDPKRSSGDKDCQMSDVKIVGNKTSWKVRCDHNGEVMTGSGEQTTTANGYEGKMHFEGKSHGRDNNMTMAFSGKHVGGSCDSEEQVKKMKAQICDTSHYRSTADWISSADMILQPGSACGEQRKQLCDLVLKDAPRDVRAYNALLQHDQHMVGGVSVAKECKLDMASATKSICKTLDSENYSQLSASCPAEAKAFRETQRRRECEGRSYTAETRAADIKKCLSGKDDSADDNASGGSASAQQAGKPSGSSPASEALDAAKKLRSKFGF